MDIVSKVYGLVDVPYSFTDEKGNQRVGVTRKAFVVDYDEDEKVSSAYTAKCVPDCELSIGSLVHLDYDKYGRVRSARSISRK